MKRSKLLAMAVLTTVASVGFVVSANAQEKAAQKAAETPAYTLGEIVVESERETMAGGFLKNDGYVGILGKKDIMEIPFTVTSIGAKTLENFKNPTNGITDALSFSPSVRTQRGGNYTEVNVRGFKESGYGISINGIPGMLAMEKTPSNFVESVTIVSGPNIGVNGTNTSGSDGGSINFKTKVAQDDPVNTITIGYNGGASFEESIDYGQRFGKDNEWGVRVNASNGHGKTVIDNGRTEKRNIYLNIDHRGEKSNTNVFMGHSYTKDRAVTGAFSFGSDVTTMPDAPDASKAYRPDWLYHEYENYIFTLNHNQKLNDHLEAFLNAGYHDQNWFGFMDVWAEGGIKIDKDGNYNNHPYNDPMHNKTTYFGVGLRGDFKVGTVKNDYVVSVDRSWINSYLTEFGYSEPHFNSFSGSLSNGVNPSIADDHHGVAGDPTGDQYGYNKTMLGWHLVDTMTALDDKLSVTLGLHGHNAKLRRDSGEDTDKSAISPTYAVSYKITPEVMVFADHTENFGYGTQLSKYDDNNNLIYRTITDPAKTKQNEIGVKFKSGNFVNTVSLFDITKPSYSVGGSTGNYYVVTSEQNNKGIEWGFTGKVSDKVDFVGAVTYLKAKQDSGKAVNGIPNWSANVGSIYHFNDDFSAKMRLNYVGKSTIKNEALDVPAYFTVDLGATYKSKVGTTPVTYDLMCYNLLGKNYWVSCGGENTVYLGSPRTLTLSATFQI